MVRMKTLDSFFKRKRDESIDGEGQDLFDAPSVPQLLELQPARQEEEEQQQQEEEVRFSDQEPHRQEAATAQCEEREEQGQGEDYQTNEPVMFRGIEFLERDPALRPQIWQYPNNQRDQVVRAYLHLGPIQPLLKKYKPSGPKGHRRHFQYIWFSQFPSWLEYSESSGRAYCFFCFLCSKNIKKRGGFDVFTAQGFDTWKKVNDGKSVHC